MTDLRNYKDAFRQAVAQVKDRNWKWSVKAVNKSTARIGWGYLDYIGEKPFEVSVLEENGDVAIIAKAGDKKVYCLIGEKFWCDVKTIEDGIMYAVNGLAYYAHNYY